MNSKMKRALNTSALATAISLTAFRANAERLTFNLPVEAHWGTVVLQPGKYMREIPFAPEMSKGESDRTYIRPLPIGKR